MFYTIYQITNLVNNKIYIGAHKTNNLNDYYFGSNKNVKLAIKKYGKTNLKKEYLFIFTEEDLMWDKEKELVNENFVKRRDTYNMKLGGNGGWKKLINGEIQHINKDPEVNIKRSETLKNLFQDKENPKLLNMIAKREKTSIEKYGVKHNFCAGFLRDNMMKSVEEKYGVTNVSYLPEVKAKIGQANKGNTHGNKKVVIEGIEFASMKEAMAETGISYRKLRILMGNPI